MIDPTGGPRSAVLVDGDRMVGGSADDIKAFKGIPFAVPPSKTCAGVRNIKDYDLA